MNALAELVRVLGVQFDENDALRLRLDALACELADRLKYPTRRGTDRGGEEAGTERQALPFLAVDRHFLESVRSVARVGVLRILDGRSQRTYTGTGWLVTSDLALTCAHVMTARCFEDWEITEGDLGRQVKNAIFLFDFEQPGSGIEYGVDRLEDLDPETDYALLRLKDRPDAPLVRRGFLVLDTDAPLNLQTRLLVPQHPGGEPMRRADGFYQKAAATAARFFHDVPTGPGASGAPLFNMSTVRVVAIHRGENLEVNLREGIPIRAVLEALRVRKPDLYDVIMEAQAIRRGG